MRSIISTVHPVLSRRLSRTCHWNQRFLLLPLSPILDPEQRHSGAGNISGIGGNGGIGGIGGIGGNGGNCGNGSRASSGVTGRDVEYPSPSSSHSGSSSSSSWSSSSGSSPNNVIHAPFESHKASATVRYGRIVRNRGPPPSNVPPLDEESTLSASSPPLEQRESGLDGSDSARGTHGSHSNQRIRRPLPGRLLRHPQTVSLHATKPASVDDDDTKTKTASHASTQNPTISPNSFVPPDEMTSTILPFPSQNSRRLDALRRRRLFLEKKELQQLPDENESSSLGTTHRDTLDSVDSTNETQNEIQNEIPSIDSIDSNTSNASVGAGNIVGFNSSQSLADRYRLQRKQLRQQMKNEQQNQQNQQNPTGLERDNVPTTLSHSELNIPKENETLVMRNGRIISNDKHSPDISSYGGSVVAAQSATARFRLERQRKRMDLEKEPTKEEGQGQGQGLGQSNLKMNPSVLSIPLSDQTEGTESSSFNDASVDLDSKFEERYQKWRRQQMKRRGVGSDSEDEGGDERGTSRGWSLFGWFGFGRKKD